MTDGVLLCPFSSMNVFIALAMLLIRCWLTGLHSSVKVLGKKKYSDAKRSETNTACLLIVSLSEWDM